MVRKEKVIRVLFLLHELGLINIRCFQIKVDVCFDLYINFPALFLLVSFLQVVETLQYPKAIPTLGSSRQEHQTCVYCS